MTGDYGEMTTFHCGEEQLAAIIAFAGEVWG